MSERSDSERVAVVTRISAGGRLWAMTFSPNGRHLLTSNSSKEVRVWQVEDGEVVTTIRTSDNVNCLAVSPDNKWIAAGTWGSPGNVIIWDAGTYKQVFAHRQDSSTGKTYAVNFSPDSTRFVSTSDDTAYVWDIATGKRILTLHHKGLIRNARYSPQGDQIATAALYNCVRVWNGHNGRFIMDLEEGGTSNHVKDLLWSDDSLFVVRMNTTEKFDVSSKSTVAKLLIHHNSTLSSAVLTKDERFLVYSTKSAVVFWDVSTDTQLDTIQHIQDISTIVLSPDDQFLAIGDVDGSVTIKRLCVEEPDVGVYAAALDLWKNDQLEDVDLLLTTAIATSQNPTHPVLASRALVRARLQQWDAALVDAEMSRPSVISFIAKSLALAGNGDRHEAYQACDVACQLYPSYASFLLLIKAIIMFMVGEHRDAILRIDDLITKLFFNSACYAVKAYMHLLLGKSCMRRGDYEGAIQSFEQTRAGMRHYDNGPLLAISLVFGWKFDSIHVTIQRCLCDALYAVGRINDAVDCFNHVTTELGGDANFDCEHLSWALEFRQGLLLRLEDLGDKALHTHKYDEAISHYSGTLSFHPSSPYSILIKRSKAYMAAGYWNEAVSDANQMIVLDASSPWGYEVKYEALHKMGDYGNAVDALEGMLSNMVDSSDPDIRHRCAQYKNPSSIRASIRKVVKRVLRDSPHVLINTTTGHLFDRDERASLFESLPIFDELVSSMSTRIDRGRIRREVQQYFRYVMLSHNWEDNEPLFQQVVHIAVYDLEHSATHDKLQMFCKVVLDSGFNWAWSDTCCIDKSDHFVLQEALVSMFKWYQGSIMTIVFLRGVGTSSLQGTLAKSIWNTRSWTLQEYIAAKVIRFYTEDWSLYQDLELPNHKESPDVVSEMEHATGISAMQLMALRPGLTSIREKLRLASTRKTTRVEDSAYSLLGIFSAAGIPAIYGEGNVSLGRLLANVLTRSGDVSVLAWTGESGGFNSCLPANIMVLNGSALSHLPPPIQDSEIERILTGSHTFSFDLDMALKLYDRLNELPTPWFAESRMMLPCIAFRLPPLSGFRMGSSRVYRADTVAFGAVEIKTKYDLSRMRSLYLIHPWLDTLLSRDDVQSDGFVEDDGVPSQNMDDEEISDGEIESEETDDGEHIVDYSSFPDPDSPSPTLGSVHLAPVDRETGARRLVAGLGQPFGALLVTLASTGRRTMHYRRVAADCLITVQFQGSISLAEILDNVRTLEIL